MKRGMAHRFHPRSVPNPRGFFPRFRASKRDGSLRGILSTRERENRGPAPDLSVPLAAICGLAIAALVIFVFNKVFRATQGSSEGRVAELFGQAATVITPIAAGGVGEIAYVQGGTRYTAAARAQDGREIPSGVPVRIVRVAGTQYFVTQE